MCHKNMYFIDDFALNIFLFLMEFANKVLIRSRENPSTMRRKVKFYYFFGFTAIRFRLTDAMHLIQRALESPDLEEHFQYQIQCEKIKKKVFRDFLSQKS